MHGYKSTINWGTLRETYACALIYESGLLNTFNDKNKLLIWDPFCGCGTILIELFLLAAERNIRPIDDISKEAFTNLPFHKTNEFKKFIQDQRTENQNYTITFRNENTDIHFLGSDIDVKAVDALVKNSVKADLNKYVIKVLDKALYTKSEHAVTDDHNNVNKVEHNINLSINPNIFHEKVNNVFNAFIGDFENIYKEVLQNDKLPLYKTKKFTIFSNIPYGTSDEMSDKIQIKSLYKRFGRFLRKNTNQLEDVYILVNCRDEKDELNFKKLTELKWKTLCKFDNNGIEVEFLKMSRE
jgi:23S rRNA G2445 N2-methylase RlmL